MHRRRSRAVAGLCGLGLLASTIGCSFLLREEGEGVPPDAAVDAVPVPEDCETALGEPVKVYEGQGATAFEDLEWPLRPRLIQVEGESLPSGDGTLIVAAAPDSPIEVISGAFNGEIGVLEVAFPIDRMRPVSGASETSVTALFAFSLEEDTCVRIPIEAIYLPELAGEISSQTALERYSFIDLRDLNPVGTEAVELRSTSAMVTGGAVKFSASTITGGPGGGNGGGMGANGDFGASGGRAGAALLGGGGGHAADASGPRGGLASGHRTLLRLDVAEPRGGHGGGGSDTGTGGGGGGALFVRARSALVIELDTMVDATGAVGVGGGVGGGPGSAGTLFLAAPSLVRDQTLITVDVEGFAMASGGRVRIDTRDAAAGVTLTSAIDTTFWLGAVISSKTRIVTEPTVSLSLDCFNGHPHLQPSDPGRAQLLRELPDGSDEIIVDPFDTPTPNLFTTLVPGVNRICIETIRDGVPDEIALPEDRLVARNCIEVGYVPQVP